MSSRHGFSKPPCLWALDIYSPDAEQSSLWQACNHEMYLTRFDVCEIIHTYSFLFYISWHSLPFAISTSRPQKKADAMLTPPGQTHYQEKDEEIVATHSCTNINAGRVSCDTCICVARKPMHRVYLYSIASDLCLTNIIAISWYHCDNPRVHSSACTLV